MEEVINMNILLTFLMSFVMNTFAAQVEYDLAGEIEKQCGKPGYRKEIGCVIELPKGELLVKETQIGTCDNTMSQRMGVTLVGKGTSGFATVPRYSTAGTTLVYNGAPGGTMISICGSRNYFRDFAVDGLNSGTVFEWRANNSKSAISHLGGIERVDILDGGTGVKIIGELFNDQIDFLSFRDMTIRGVDVCVDQDSQQAVANNFTNVDCASKKAGVIVRNGIMHFFDFYTGQLERDVEYKGFYLTKTNSKVAPYMSRGPVSITRSHMEIHTGRFIVDDSGSNYALNLQNNTFQMLTPTANAEMTLIDSNTRGPINMIGDWITGGASPNPTGRICHRGGGINKLGVTNTDWVKVIWGCK